MRIVPVLAMVGTLAAGLAGCALSPATAENPEVATRLADIAAAVERPPAATPCVEADVLGGPWDDAPARWWTMVTAIDEWAPDGNTFPTLPSHPQRVVGWATLTLGTEDLDAAHEYAGHAMLHVDITRAAFTDCG